MPISERPEPRYFPQIDLTGLLGAQSRALTSLFTGPARDWSFAPAISLPIFNAGRIRNGVRLTEAQKQEAVANYEKAIQSAFREVSDSLVGYRRTAEQRTQEELLVKALQDSVRLSNLRYGAASTAICRCSTQTEICSRESWIWPG